MAPHQTAPRNIDSAESINAFLSAVKAGYGARPVNAEKSELVLKNTLPSKQSTSSPSPKTGESETSPSDTSSVAFKKTQSIYSSVMTLNYQAAIEAVNAAHPTELPNESLVFAVAKVASYSSAHPGEIMRMLAALKDSKKVSKETTATTNQISRPPFAQSPASASVAADPNLTFSDEPIPTDAAAILSALAARSTKTLKDSIHAPRPRRPAPAKGPSVKKESCVPVVENEVVSPTKRPWADDEKR